MYWPSILGSFFSEQLSNFMDFRPLCFWFNNNVNVVVYHFAMGIAGVIRISRNTIYSCYVWPNDNSSHSFQSLGCRFLVSGLAGPWTFLCKTMDLGDSLFYCSNCCLYCIARGEYNQTTHGSLPSLNCMFALLFKCEVPYGIACKKIGFLWMYFIVCSDFC